jgi:hypothetical protein
VGWNVFRCYERLEYQFQGFNQCSCQYSASELAKEILHIHVLIEILDDNFFE